MPNLPAARLILSIICGSYLLSAGLLTWARVAGQVVPGWKIGGWVITGIVGFLLLIWLSPNPAVAAP